MPCAARRKAAALAKESLHNDLPLIGNAASWEEAPDFVVGHPDDKAELERMTSAADVDKWGALTRGAYYGHEARRPGLFDDL